MGGRTIVMLRALPKPKETFFTRLIAKIKRIPVTGRWGALYCGGGVFCFLWYLVHESNKGLGVAQKRIDAIGEGRAVQDPNRVPWPVIHQTVTEMREGKRGLDEIANLWEQTRHYYPDDWLVPFEISQIIKYSNGYYLSFYVPDAEEFRQEVLRQLRHVCDNNNQINVVAGSGGARRVTSEVEGIVRTAIDDLSKHNLSTDPNHISLVPSVSHGRGS